MPKQRTFQSNFSGGLLSSQMRGRIDTNHYQNGCLTLDNTWPSITGGQSRRPGTRLRSIIHAINNSAAYDHIRVEPFVFNEDQVYLVVWTNETIGLPNTNLKIYSLNTASIYEWDVIDSLEWPRVGNEILDYSVAQLGDTMIVAGKNLGLKVIKRVSATGFTLSDFAWEGQGADGTDYPLHPPFYKFAEPHVTIDPSGHEGTITVTANANIFTSEYVGRLIRYRSKQILVTAYNSPTVVTGNVIEELDQGAIITFSDGNAEDYELTEIVVGRDSGAKAEVVFKTGNVITVAMIAGTIADASVYATGEELEGLESGNICTVSARVQINPPEHYDWDEEAYSDERGWPTVVEFHSQRLWLGGSSSLPAHIFGSKVAAFFNFDPGEALPNDSIQAAIVDKQIGKISDIVGGRHLQVFTDYAEYYAPQYEDKPLVPETFDLRMQTRYGSKKNVFAQVFDESTVYVQGQGSTVREFIWESGLGGYQSEPISILADEHIGVIYDMTVLYGGYSRPEQLALFVNEDGNILWYHSSKAEQVKSWGRWTTDGDFKSVCVINDRIVAVVERNGQYCLEEFTFETTLDCAVALSGGAPTSDWDLTTSVLPYAPYDGLTVSAVIDQTDFNGNMFTDYDGIFPNEFDGLFYLGDYAVTAASPVVSLPVAVRKLQLGLNFEQDMEPMPVEVQDPRGVSGGLPKRIVCLNVLVNSTLSIAVNGTQVKMSQSANGNFLLNQSPVEKTGLHKFYLLGYDENPTVRITNSIPLKCDVLALSMEVEY